MDVLALAPGVEVAADTTGGSTVDTENIKQTFRYGVLRDTRPETPGKLMRREVSFLLIHGWHGARAGVNYTRPDGTVVLRDLPLETPGAIIFITRGSDIHAALEGVTAKSAAIDGGSLDCCAEDPAVRSAIGRGEPLITVSMYRS